MSVKIDANNRLGEEIMSNREVTKSVKQMRTAMYCMAAGLVLVAALELKDTPDKPPVLVAETGQVIVDYNSNVDKLSLEERMEYAAHVFRGLRQRTGIAPVDVKALEAWKGQITPNGARSWKGLGDRWDDIAFVQPGKMRMVQVTKVRPDLVNQYAYVIEATEAEGLRDDPRSDRQYRVRLTLFFTDPKETNGASRLDALQLHEEGTVK